MPTPKISLPHSSKSSPRASPPEPTVLNFKFFTVLEELNDFIIFNAVGGKKVFFISSLDIKSKVNSGSNF